MTDDEVKKIYSPVFRAYFTVPNVIVGRVYSAKTRIDLREAHTGHQGSPVPCKKTETA